MVTRSVSHHVLLFLSICVGTSVLDVLFSLVRNRPPVASLRELWTDPIWWFVLLFTYYIVTRMARKKATYSRETSDGSESP